MICGLFSSFDPSILSSSLKSKWFIICLIFLILPQANYPLGVGFYLSKFLNVVFNVVSGSFKNYKSPMLMMGSLFLFILCMNLSGMVPYLFSATSHLVTNLSLSLCLWSSALVYSVFKSMKGLISHLVPIGSPMALWPLLVLVESVSLVIRPWTLAIRLMANVMAGHLIMNLLGGGLAKMTALFSIPSTVMMVGFIFFEICVSVIQSYVFTSLLALYWSE